MKKTAELLIILTLFVFFTDKRSYAQESVSSKFKISLYGFVKYEAFYDDTEVAKGDWLLFAKPGNSDESEQNIFSMNVRHTRLGLKITGPELINNGKILSLIEADFAGGFPNSSTAARQPLLRLRHAWVELNYPKWEARFGQDWALISGPFPNTTSFVVGAGKGNLWMRMPQVKFTVKQDKIKWAFSLNRPMAGNTKYNDNEGGDFDIVADGERSGLPWIMSRLWLTAGKSTISFSGHYGQEQINDASGNPHDIKSYSLNADLILRSGPVTITGRFFTGENLNTFFGGVFQGFTVIPNSVSTVKSTGGWGQWIYKMNDKWSYTFGSGIDNPEDNDLSKGKKGRNDWFFTNFTRSIGNSVSMMLEYSHLKTNYIDSVNGTNNRIQFVTYFKF